jgi:hypothetical protein
MPGVLEVPMPSWMMESTATRVPEWETAQIVYRDAAGQVCGYGYSERQSGTFTVAAGPELARQLAGTQRVVVVHYDADGAIIGHAVYPLTASPSEPRPFDARRPR